MKAMIFSAGLGTRFKPWTDSHPKALALVNGKTLLQRNIEYLQQYGIYDVVINVHHFASQITDILKENNGWGSRCEISDETGELLDTGGGLLKAQPFFEKEQQFISVNADILTDLNIHKLVEYHNNRKGLISFGVTERKTSRYFLFDEDNRLCGWRNDNSGEEKLSRIHHAYIPKAYSCVAVFEKSVFEKMNFTGKFSLTDVYLDLATTEFIQGYDHTGDRWVDVGKTESVAKAETLFP